MYTCRVDGGWQLWDAWCSGGRVAALGNHGTNVVGLCQTQSLHTFRFCPRGGAGLDLASLLKQ